MLRRFGIGVVVSLLVFSTVATGFRTAGSATRDTGWHFGRLLWLPPGPFDPLKSVPQVRPELAATPGNDLFVVQLDLSGGVGRAQNRFFGQAQALEARVLGYVPEAAYLVRVSPAGADAFRPFARAVVPYHPAYKLHPQLAKEFTTPEFRIVAQPDSNAAIIARDLRTQGVKANAASQRIATVTNRPGLIDRLVDDPRVLAVIPRGIFKTLNTEARWVTQSTQRDYTPLFRNEGLDGSNEAVAIADTGVDYYPDPVGKANFFFSDCSRPLVPTRATCRLADRTYQAMRNRDLLNGVVHDNQPLGTHRKVIAYFNEVADGDPNSTAWRGDSGASTHGSHVSGSVAGSQPRLNADGSVASYPGDQKYDGQAPKAKIVFQDIGNDDERLSGLPDDLYRLFDQAYDVAGDQASDATEFPVNGDDDLIQAEFENSYIRGITPRIHSNSWGSIVPEVSLGDSPRLDDFVVLHEDFLPIFAAGNSGPNGASVGEPGTAKDALTVGAMANGRDDYASLDTMANFSSHGAAFAVPGSCVPITGLEPFTTCTFKPEPGEIKPDVAAPGLHVISPKGGTNTAVQVLQGTSMATPTAAGDAVLVRQYFGDGFGPAGGSGFASGTRDTGRSYNASAALVKAIMIASAQRMRGWYTGDDGTNRSQDGQWPSSGQGWGRVQLDSALHFNDIAGSPGLFIDDVKHGLGHPGAAAKGVATGDEVTRTVRVQAGQPLRVVLDWSDPGGLSSFNGLGPEALTNVLQLRVEAPDGRFYCGNQINTRDPLNASADVATSVAGRCVTFAPGVGGAGITDVFNNVQVVYLPTPVAGDYKIKVQALMVSQPQDTVGIQILPACTALDARCKQGYALVATGNLGPAGAVPPAPPTGAPGIGPVQATAYSGDAAVLRWTTSSATVSSVTISGPGVGGSRTLEDDYSYDSLDYPGLTLVQIETQGKNFLHKPVVSDRHEVKLTGLVPGASYSVTVTATDLAGHTSVSATSSFKTPATSYAPTNSSETANLFQNPAGVPLPVGDPSNPDPWGKSSQFYVGTAAANVTSMPIDAIGAFRITVPTTAPTTNLAGAVVMMASRQDITSHVQDLPAHFVELLAPPARWGSTTTYTEVKTNAAAAKLTPNASHLRTTSLTWEAYTLTCNDLSALTGNLTSTHQAAFRVSGSQLQAGERQKAVSESLYGYESGFGRRASGLEYRPILVLFPDNHDPLAQAGGTPTISDVRVERQNNTGTVVVYWQTDIPANSIVLVRHGGDVYQVGSPAFVTAHQVQLNGVDMGVGDTFAARSISSDGRPTTSGAYAVPDAIGSQPPEPPLADPVAGNFSTVPTHDFATASDRAHGTGFGCAQPPPPPPCQEADGNGDFQGDQLGNFEFDQDGCIDGDVDNVRSSNRGDGKSFQSTQIQSVKLDNLAHSMTVSGVGLVGGAPVSFLFVAIEPTALTPGWVSLSFSDGYTNRGNLIRGSILLH